MARHGGEMGSETADRSSRRRRGIRIRHVAFALFLCGVASILFLRWHWRHEFHRRIEAIRAAGYPITPKEHDAWYEWPQSGDNAAHWILGATAMYQEPPQEDWQRLQRIVLWHNADRPHPAEPLAADLKGLLEQYIRVNAKALESLHDASTIAECRYPMDLSRGLGNGALGHISEVRKAVLLLCLEAVLHAEGEDPNEAVASVTAAIHVADSLDDEPLMISRMVRTSGLIASVAALERILNRVELTPPQLDGLYQALHALDLRSGLLRAFAGERCLMCSFLEKPTTIDRQAFDELPPKALLEVYDALGFSDREGAIYLDLMEECIRIAQLPVSQYRGAVHTARNRYLQGRKTILLSHTGYVVGIMHSETLHAARLEMARVSSAVERYRRVHGELPETLDPLVPGDMKAVPEDPYDGKPLRYRRLDRGYVVYSVGEDGRDDGGKEQRAKDSRTPGETCDLVFQVRR